MFCDIGLYQSILKIFLFSTVFGESCPFGNYLLETFYLFTEYLSNIYYTFIAVNTATLCMSRV